MVSSVESLNQKIDKTRRELEILLNQVKDNPDKVRNIKSSLSSLQGKLVEMLKSYDQIYKEFEKMETVLAKILNKIPRLKPLRNKKKLNLLKKQ